MARHPDVDRRGGSGLHGAGRGGPRCGGDLFIGGGYYEDAIGLTKAAAEVDYAPLLISLSLGPGDPRFATEVGDLARCVAGNAPWIHTIGTSGFIADSEFFVQEYENLYGRPPGYHAAAGFGAVELLAEAINATISPLGYIDRAAVRDHLFTASTETVLGPFNVYPLRDEQAGAQRALKGLQVQWQDDGQGGPGSADRPSGSGGAGGALLFEVAEGLARGGGTGKIRFWVRCSYERGE